MVPCPDDQYGPKLADKFRYEDGGSHTYYRCPTCGQLLGRYETRHNITTQEAAQMRDNQVGGDKAPGKETNEQRI